eukprot:scaffold261090_cov32-Tisochrysis_lutea.AAC.1
MHRSHHATRPHHREQREGSPHAYNHPAAQTPSSSYAIAGPEPRAACVERIAGERPKAMQSVHTSGCIPRRACSACGVPASQMNTGTPRAAIATAASTLARIPPVTSWATSDDLKPTKPLSWPERETTTSRNSWAPSVAGGRSKTPGTSVRKTARLGCRSAQSATRRSSPLKMQLSNAAPGLKTASPCRTGTRPALSTSRTRCKAAPEPLASPLRHPNAKGGSEIAAMPSRSSAASTS